MQIGEPGLQNEATRAQRLTPSWKRATSELMKIGFIGGNGHHYLRGCLDSVEAAAASDGVDAPSAQQRAQSLGITRWSKVRMFIHAA